MRAGVFNVIFGIVAIGMGLSGKFSLLFTNSSTALIVFGGACSAWGLFQIFRDRSRGPR